MKLQDKVAVITGANSGIGKAIANRFAAEGAHVCINYRPNLENEKQAGALAKELTQQHKVEALPVAADVTKRDQLEAMMERIVERFGRLDVAVNNAGIEIQKPFLEVPDDEWNKVMTVNCYGSFVVAQLAARQMVAQGGGGKIVNISSVHEDIPFVGYTAYCASKGAMRMMTRNIAMELAPHKINVNNIAPGAIATPINQEVLDDPEAKAAALTEIPWGRFGTPDEVARVAVFLASADSEYVTGSTYYVDGGLTQQVTKY